MLEDDADALSRLRRLERATAGSNDGYWERNLRTQTSWYSPSFRTLFGFAPDELPDDRDAVNARMHPDDRPAFLRRYEQAIADLGKFTYELRYLNAAGDWQWIRGRGQVWPGADGRPEYIAGACSDMQAEMQAKLALEQANRRFERAIEAAAEGLFERIVGEDTLYMSDRYLELIGNKRGDFPPLREQILCRFHPEDAPAVLATLRDGEEHLRRWEVFMRFRHASGAYRWYRQRGIAERMADGRVKVTGMIADVHEQMLAQQEQLSNRSRLEAMVAERTARLKQALALARERQLEAERANAAKSRFLAHMSHELRTPLNGVLGLVELAQLGAQLPDQKRYLETARRSGQTLAQVINGILDFSRIEAGRTELRLGRFDVAQALVETLRHMMPMVRERGVMLLFDWTEGPFEVLADETAIRQIATNLAGNAAKFTQHGQVEVVGSTRPLPDGRLQLQISFTDTGPGVPQALRERIFEPFTQGDEALTRKHGGTGLGLSIARGLAQAMGGDIGLECPPGGGSRFTLSMPVAAPPGAVVPLSDEVHGQAPTSLGVAWVVAVSPSASEWLVRRLRRSGWQTRKFASVDQLLQAAREDPAPQLVLLSELALHAGMNLAPLRAALPTTPIRLVVRPDWHEPQLEAHARALDMPCVQGPMTPRDLAQLDQAGAPSGRWDQASVNEAASPPPAPGWAPGSDVLLVEDNPVNQLIGQEFLRSLGLGFRTASDGAEAVQACLQQPPALVLMDLQMPGMDGFEATRQLRALQQQGRWPGAPILALTAHASSTDHAACLAAGMDAVLTKPLSLAQLREQLGRYLGTRSG